MSNGTYNSSGVSEPCMPTSAIDAGVWVRESTTVARPVIATTTSPIRSASRARDVAKHACGDPLLASTNDRVIAQLG